MENKNVIDKIIDIFVDNQDPRTKQWFLSGSMTPLITILAAYLYFCLSAGPRFMKNRKPFDLKYIMVAYNAIQVVLSLYIVYEGLVAGWLNHYSYRCQPVDYSMNPIALRMASGVWFYYICKLTELLDTIFFVLRKRQRQVSTLHVYHHTVMPIAAFIGVKYLAGGHGTLLGPINGLIHVFMYAYYMLTAMGQQMQKYLWWKRHLTTMQIVQFLIIFVHTIQIQFQPDCKYPKFIGALLTLNAAIFTYMFSSFYYHTYIRKDNRKYEADLKKKTDDAPISNRDALTQNGQANDQIKNADQYTETGLNLIKTSWYEKPVTESTAATNILNHRIPQIYDNVKIK